MLILDSPSPLPTRLSHAGYLTLKSQITEADPAQAELAVHRARATAIVASGIGTSREFGFALRFGNQTFLRHWLLPVLFAEGHAQRLQQFTAFFVAIGRGNDGDIHAPDLIDHVIVDLGEDNLLFDA